jgi:transcriptional regulator with XRE-family HTH domain
MAKASAAATETLLEWFPLLRAARLLVNLTQEQLAFRATVSKSVVQKIESEEPTVLVGSVEKVRTALEKSGVVFLPSADDHTVAIALRRVKRIARPRVDFSDS